MAYSKDGRYERANKSAHSPIINDPTVQKFLKKCKLPRKADEVSIEKGNLLRLENISDNPIDDIIVIDGSRSTVPVKKEFPSSEFTFFQFGALKFSISYLDELSCQEFIGPEDIAKLKEDFGRLKFAVPTKNIIYEDEFSLKSSFRRVIFEFFCSDFEVTYFGNPIMDNFIQTLKWLIFEEFKDNSKLDWKLASCPHCEETVTLFKSRMIDYTFICSECGEKIYLTDVFRLHEKIEEELGAGGVLGYLIRLLEQILLVHVIKIILNNNSILMNKTLFIQDGPLAFFGTTANLHKPMQNLVNYLLDYHNLYLIGLEKNGEFSEHASEISSKLELNEILILTTDYIYSYIKFGREKKDEAFGSSTYYGNKLIFKSSTGKMYVATIPTRKNLISPKKEDFPNMDIILKNINILKCELYEDAIVPIVLANRLVSISDYPSSLILEKFARDKVK